MRKSLFLSSEDEKFSFPYRSSKLEDWSQKFSSYLLSFAGMNGYISSFISKTTQHFHSASIQDKLRQYIVVKFYMANGSFNELLMNWKCESLHMQKYLYITFFSFYITFLRLSLSNPA